MAPPTLDKRHTIHESGWHGADGAWGDGVQHEVIESIPQLAATLEAKNGIPGLEIVQPSTDPAFAERASSLLQRDGFVCIADVVPEELRAALQLKCEESMEQIVALDQYQGAKGAWRYMFGGSSLTGECVHFIEWARLAELPVLDAVLTQFFGSPDYTCHGGGGDFCLPGSEYQPLHSDLGDAVKLEFDGDVMTDRLALDAPERPDRRYTRGNAFFDPTGKLSVRDLPAPQLVAGFAVTPWGHLDGATRYIAGTHTSHAEMPSLADEPDWMKHATVSPLPAGSAVLRDIRVWHGGCPAVGERARAMPVRTKLYHLKTISVADVGSFKGKSPIGGGFA
jgi:hypothetical protein